MGPNRELLLDIDPSAELGPAQLRIQAGEIDARVTVERRSILSVRTDFEAGLGVEVIVEVVNQLSRNPLTVDPRDLGFRVYSARIVVTDNPDSDGVRLEAKDPPTLLNRLRMFFRLWRSGAPGMRLRLPLPGVVLNSLRPRIEETGLSIAITRPEPKEVVVEEEEPSDTVDAEEEEPSDTVDAEEEEPSDTVDAEEEEPSDTVDAVADSETEGDSDADESAQRSNLGPSTDLHANECGDFTFVDESAQRPNLGPSTDLHTNACGDFTLLSLDDWLDLRGYPEWDMYSMNIDSMLCISAAHAGLDEVFLTERVYHIEHAAGSGFTPEGQHHLWNRLREKGIDWVEYDEVLDIGHVLGRLKCTAIFNRNDWGLMREQLPETVIHGKQGPTEET